MKSLMCRYFTFLNLGKADAKHCKMTVLDFQDNFKRSLKVPEVLFVRGICFCPFVFSLFKCCQSYEIFLEASGSALSLYKVIARSKK